MEGFEGANGCRMPGEANAELDAWEGLAATLQTSPAKETIPQPAGEAPKGEPNSVALPEAEARGTIPVDPGALAALVGEEVASVLKAAQVAAAEIRSKAEDVAADTQRRISEMLSALAQMSAEMTDLMTRVEERVPFVPGADATGGSATPARDAAPTSEAHPTPEERPTPAREASPTPVSVGSRSTPDEPIVIEHRSGNGTAASDSRPDVSERPGDYQRWLQRMVELSSQEPR
jgi:hypothetical protein